MREYNEKNSSDSYEDLIDLDTNEPIAPVVDKKTDKKRTQQYMDLIKWAEDRRDTPFLKESILKHFKAFKMAMNNNIQPKDLMDRWEELEKDKFYDDKGFDWMTVVYSFNRKPKG